MPAKTNPPAVLRPRRTQADRMRETRSKLIAAAVKRIARGGYATATLSEIARDAKLTKGAIQHHFAGKRELDVAVFVHGYTELLERLAKITAEGDLQTRVSAVVDATYDAYLSDAVQAAYEIGRAWRRKPPPADVIAPFMNSHDLDEQWRHLFPEVRVSDERLVQTRRLLRETVQGQVLRMARGVPDDTPLDRETLKTAVMLLLTSEPPKRRLR